MAEEKALEERVADKCCKIHAQKPLTAALKWFFVPGYSTYEMLKLSKHHGGLGGKEIGFLCNVAYDMFKISTYANLISYAANQLMQ